MSTNTPAQNIDLLVEYAKTLSHSIDELARNECAEVDIQTSAATLLIKAGYQEQTILRLITSIDDATYDSFRDNFYRGKQIAAISAL
jgi:copper oxidase (laccase) domain-containing protein